MRDDFTPAVRAVQDRLSDPLVIVYVVSPYQAASGDNPARPMIVQSAIGDAAPFEINQLLSTFEADNVEEGDAVLIGRLTSNRWVGVGKVV